MHRLIVVAFAALCLIGTSSFALADDAMKSEMGQMKADVKGKKVEMKAKTKASKEAKKEDMKGKAKAHKTKMKAKGAGQDMKTAGQ